MEKIRIAITTGDSDGIGTEVTAKALHALRPQRDVIFFFWRSPTCPDAHLKLIDRRFKRKTVFSWSEALRASTSHSNSIVDICSNLTPPKWVEIAAHACKRKHLNGLTTAPLSKTLIKDSGLKDKGHTDILKRITKSEDVFMTFIGSHFNVLLVTDHIPLKKVHSQINNHNLLSACKAAHSLRHLFNRRQQGKPLALLGLNPHAGESGILGLEENKIVLPVIESLRKLQINVKGPLVPDVAFSRDNWSKYSIYIALYHDQGLIPFKLAHDNRSGVHLSQGLGFVRTSVDHGTAKDIFGQEKAQFDSMFKALKLCMELCRQNA